MDRGIKIRDYSYTVRRRLPVGEHAEVIEEVKRHGEEVLIPGDVVQVVRYTNAGFGGILADVLTVDGRTIHNVSAGILDCDC